MRLFCKVDAALIRREWVFVGNRWVQDMALGYIRWK